MIEQIDYTVKQGAATVWRCYGEGSVAQVPGRIAGYPVTAIADHCFAREQSAGAAKAGICRYRSASAGDAVKPLRSDTLREIILPESLTEIGDYAFYNCDVLEQLTLPSSINRIGRGAFVAANHIRQIVFMQEGSREMRTPACFRDVVGEIGYEVETVIRDASGEDLLCLLFPEYYEDSVENTPARIISVAYEGTGFKYRQCFRGHEIDLRRYDELFPVASVQELPETVLQLIFVRLKTPTLLSAQARSTYLEYLCSHSAQTLDKILREERPDLLSMLNTEGFLTGGMLDEWTERAACGHYPWAVSLLMDMRRARAARISGARRRYEL